MPAAPPAPSSPSAPPPAAFRRIAVFCGSSAGTRPEFRQAAVALGVEMARRGIGLVYGGGNIGLMGAVAETVRDGGQSVVGVIPKALQPREISGTTVGELRVVKSMHERKRMMFDEADAFIALPGGFGTLEELLEMITWSQLGFHKKPVGILNCEGFYDKLLAFFDDAVTLGFVAEASRAIVVDAGDAPGLLDALEAHRPPPPVVPPSELPPAVALDVDVLN